MGVSKNRGGKPPKMDGDNFMVPNPIETDDLGGFTPIFGNHPNFPHIFHPTARWLNRSIFRRGDGMPYGCIFTRGGMPFHPGWGWKGGPGFLVGSS